MHSHVIPLNAIVGTVSPHPSELCYQRVAVFLVRLMRTLFFKM